MTAPQRILLVEGKDDEHVIYALLKAHSVTEIFEVKGTGGDGMLLDQIPVRLKQSGLERLAVILDADEDLGSRWEQLRARLPSYSLPSQPDGDGTVTDKANAPRVGVWLMPNNALPGMLEDFLTFLVPADDPFLPHVERFLSGLPADHPRRFPQSRIAKARIHAFLSVQQEPGRPLGVAITARYLDDQCAQARSLVRWVRRVLVD